MTRTPLPSADGTVVVPAPGRGPGHWAGAASALLDDGTVWLAYRLRRPLGAGRGVGVAHPDGSHDLVTSLSPIPRPEEHSHAQGTPAR